MRIDEDRILEICRDFWRVVLGLTLETPGEPSQPDESSLSSYVNVTGEWNGAIQLECPESIARHASAMLFDTDVDTITTPDLQDTLNELVRMLAKQLNVLMPDSIKISAPKPLTGTIPASLQSMERLGEMEYTCEGRPVRLGVLESVPAAAIAATGGSAVRAG
ncbi:MAG: chemotaxis protein CheX [bacterium]|nr:chemotaxis protein CheX [bacterium]